ncbi:ComEA family DNA-binding protein [Mesonia aquimarina]|uniref:ComEA family DNA-binding protein n=1 Tax=Mesonia aquimarina TaxID=1504967 RepID=UPI000EF57A06|nr:helix-hairpin-helix domain-containing protein [Mesonia aquimarina]
MNYKKSHFVYNRSQRNGIFLLIIIIVALLGGMFYVNNSSENFTEINKTEEEKFYQKYIDSLKKIKDKKSSTFKIYPFNPNFITDYKGYTLGMTPEQIDRLHQFRSNEKWINSKADFQRVTKVSDSLLKEISPYFKFPDWVVEQRKSKQKSLSTKLSFAQKKDLNVATAKDLEAINGIGETFALRIIRYRNKLGGFVDNIQLKDVYGIPFETEEKLLNKFTVKTPKAIKRKNINTASIIDLSEIVYFNYELAREIINYRLLNEGIDTFEELAKIDDFPSHKIERIKLYLRID